jgi:hypothetical protein
MVQSVHAYSMDFLREEARQLVSRGVVGRNQPIYCLCQFIPAREWADVEHELERNSFLLRDRIGDLLSCEYWQND